MRRSIISSFKPVRNVDETDIKIIDLMTLNKNNKEISKELGVPLSTIQRRVRSLISAGYITFITAINYEKFGFKTGLLHVYLRNGDIDETAKKIQGLKHVTSIEIHIGNSDILGHVVYIHGKDLLNLISEIKKIDNIERVVWSERVYESQSKNNNDITSLLNDRES